MGDLLTVARALVILMAGAITVKPALADPPEYFARLIKDGKVTFDFYDPAQPPPRVHQGYATYRYDVAYRSRYEYQWENRPGGSRLTIRPQIGQIKHHLVNEVQLPETLNHDRRWRNSLVKHEFDHVAMTVDPRIRMLIEYLCEGTPNILRDLPKGTAVTEALVGQIVHEAVDSRYAPIFALLKANQDDLDVQTRHGTRALKDRRAYFSALFTEPNLRQHRFPLLDDVRPLLKKKSYREAVLPYQFQD